MRQQGRRQIAEVHGEKSRRCGTAPASGQCLALGVRRGSPLRYEDFARTPTSETPRGIAELDLPGEMTAEREGCSTSPRATPSAEAQAGS